MWTKSTGAESISFKFNDYEKMGVTVIAVIDVIDVIVVIDVIALIAAVDARGFKLPLKVVGKEKSEMCLPAYQLPLVIYSTTSESDCEKSDMFSFHRGALIVFNRLIAAYSMC
jgi:hypothetical protein